MRLSEQARFAGLWRCGDHPVTPSGRAYSARLCFLLEAHYWSSCSWSRNTEPAFCRPRGGSPALAQRSTGASLYWSPGCPPPAVSKLERIEGIQPLDITCSPLICEADYEPPPHQSTNLETCQSKNMHQRLCTLSFSARPSVGRAGAHAASSILRLGLFRLFTSRRSTWLMIQMPPNALTSHQRPQ